MGGVTEGVTGGTVVWWSALSPHSRRSLVHFLGGEGPGYPAEDLGLVWSALWLRCRKLIALYITADI